MKLSAEELARRAGEAFTTELNKIKDPAERYDAAMSALERCENIAGSISLIREDAVLEMYESQMSLAKIAARFGISKTRVAQLVDQASVRRDVRRRSARRDDVAKKRPAKRA